MLLWVDLNTRHRRMNAVRLRKENQVLGAEEARLLRQRALEEKQLRENKIRAELRAIVAQKLKNK
jgi:hypothetical protein